MATTYGARAVDFPDTFKSPLLQRYEPYPLLTGSAYSSHAPASWFFHPVLFPSPVAISNINVLKSLNASVPGATSQASSGTEGYSYTHGVSVFVRQDYGANSTNFSFLGSASVGLTATLSYTSTGQSMGLSWVTNSTGGTSGISSGSNAGNWSSFLTGPKLFAIPYLTTLSAGEYWFAHAHSSTAATTGSAVTLLSVSNLHIAPQVVTFGALGASVTGPNGQMGMGYGLASAVTTNATMPGSVVSAGVVNLWVQNFSNV